MARRSDRLQAALAAERLVALGVCSPDPGFCPAGTRALVLIGPQGGAGWWRHVTASPEWVNGGADPLDRWSRRVLGRIAVGLEAAALFPFDGPPWPPFQKWALQSGRMWQSPVGLLVHPQAGLWVSFRGALAVPFTVHLPEAVQPCTGCAKPCLGACPAGALGPDGYDVAACHAWLDTGTGQACMTQGCAVRRACPLSQSHARLPEHSAYHMSRFHR